MKEALSKDYFEEEFAPPGCCVYHRGSYHQLVRKDSGVHVEKVQLVEVYTQEELDSMEPAQRLKCEWRKISVLDCIQSYGGGTSGSSGSAGASSPGTPQVPFRLITCHVTAGGEDSNIDWAADLSRPAHHPHDTGLEAYRHVLKCVQLAEEAGHNNVIIGGDFCQPFAYWGTLFRQAVLELRCQSYRIHGDDGCIVACPERCVGVSNPRPFHHTTFPCVEGGLHRAYYIRIAWEMQPLP